jgi:hypothetical protein
MNNRRERGGNTTWFQREAMLQWLEVETNFKLMTGEATHGMKMVVAGAYQEQASSVCDTTPKAVTKLETVCFLNYFRLQDGL